MSLAAFAQRAPTLAQSGSEARTRVFEESGRTEKKARGDRYCESKQQDGSVDTDFIEAWQIRGR
ncbi:MAG: hypothetical protein ACRD45_08685 [Bryobacteraceae bacterium]